jgi:hypothetical protein
MFDGVHSDSFQGGLPEYLFDNVMISRADRTPCLVCGHPTGDCADGVRAPARILGEEFARDRHKEEPGVLVPADIHEEVYLTARTKTRVLVARAGTYISREKAERYGLIASP